VSRVDVLVAVVFVLAGVVEAVALDDRNPGLMAFQASGSLWLGALAVRRTHPAVPICVLGVMGVFGTLATRVLWPDAPDGGGVWIFALMLAAYSLGAHGSGRRLVLGPVMPLLAVATVDAGESGWARINGILFVSLFVGLLPTVVGRLVGVRRGRLAKLHDQRARIIQAQREQQEAMVLAERLSTAERLQPTLVEGLQAIARRAEEGEEAAAIESSARTLLARTREEVVALTAPVEIGAVPDVTAVDHVRGLRSSAQRWVVLGAGALAVGLATETSQARSVMGPEWAVVPGALVVGLALSLVWWQPVPAVALGYVATAAYSHGVAPLDGSLSGAAVALATAFAVGALSRRRTAIVGLAVCWIGHIVGVGTSDPLGDAVALLMCWLAGLVLSEVSRLVEQTRANNEVLARQEAVSATHAVVEERLQLSRDLHDAIGHSLTVVALQAGAARRLADTDPQRAEEVMRTVAKAAREGARSMTWPATSTDVTRLVDGVRATGLVIDADVSDESTLEPTQQAIAYRIVQEALTNVLRHAPGARAAVLVRRNGDAVDVVVSNTAPAGSGSGPGTGRGLDGIRERVAAAAGQVTWSTLADGGFELRVRLPMSAATVAR
jgi:signal transduction histidine kinase